MADETAPQTENEFPTGWRPEPGDSIAGTVTDISTGQGAYDPYAIVTIKPDAGGPEIAVHAFHTVLRRELARRRPKVGSHLDIAYLGKKGEGREAYHLYRVRGQGDAGGYDWGRDDPDAGSGDAPASDITPDVAELVTVPPAAATADDDSVPF